MSKLLIYDIETCANKAMVGFLNYKTGKVKQFDYTQKKKIKKHIKDATLIGFNSNNFDDIILQMMIDGESVKEMWRATTDLIVHDGRRWDYRPSIRSIDLIEVAQGKASLKLYGARLGTKTIQDLPYNPNKKHTKKMWKNVCDYNLIDLDVTKELYEELLPQLNIRADIGAQYGIDVMSRSDAQVAEDVFKKDLGIKKKPSIDKPKAVIYEAPSYVKFKSKGLKELKKKFESTVYDINGKTGKFIGQEWLKEKVVIAGVEYTIGYGGLHSNEKTMSVVGDIKNADIASMYPSLIINSGKYPIQLGEKWLTIYKSFRDKRMEIKYTDKKLSAMLKIFLNGSYGKLNSVYSILYAPHLMLDTTITGQLSLLMVIEALTDAGINVISANTDGVEYVDSTDKGKRIIDKLGREMNLEWEHASYKALHARNVNNYIAIYEGDVKSKGYYGEVDIGKNSQFPIVMEAIRQHLFTGVPMEEVILECKDPNQFCFSRQVNGGALYSPETYPNTDEFNNFIVEFDAGERKDNKALRARNVNYQKEFLLAEADKWYLGKVIRVYYSTDGKPIYTKAGNQVGLTNEYNGVKPMMKLSKKVPKDIDYNAYITTAEKDLKLLGVSGDNQ